MSLFDEPEYEPAPSGGTLQLTGLNPDQLDAVVHTSGPLLVVAGAGSGKTRVLTHRIAHLIENEGVHPQRILAITFTNKAAGEMKERVAHLVGPVAKNMWVSTFHAACVRILRANAKALGYPRSFSIYDQADSQRLTGYVIRDLNLDPKRFTPRGRARRGQQVEERAAVPRRGPAGGEHTHGPPPRRDLSVEYQDRLLKAGAMDFDDLLTNTVRLFRDHPDVLQQYRERFQHILIDEYQDTNTAQNEMVLMLAGEHQNITVVGDQDQSIFRFRGADFRNILQFENAFPEVTTIVLNQNYRSTQMILDAANAVIANNPTRKAKQLWSELGRGEGIVRYHADDEGDEAMWVARTMQDAHDNHAMMWKEIGDLLSHERAEPRRRGSDDALRHPLQGGRRYPLLRPPRDQGCDGVPARRRQPGRRGEHQAGPQRAQARHRRAERGQARRLGARIGARVHGRDAPRRRRRPLRVGGAGCRRVRALLDSLAHRLEGSPADVLQAALDASGYMAELEAESSVEAAGRLENIARAGRLGARVHHGSTSSSSRCRWWPTPTTSTTTTGSC